MPDQERKWPLLQSALEKCFRPAASDATVGKMIVFVRTKVDCDTLAARAKQDGYSCVVLRGEVDQADREQRLRSFRLSTVPLLIATDVASRGLDVDDVT